MLCVLPMKRGQWEVAGVRLTDPPSSSKLLFAFTTPLSLVNSMARIHVRLLGPCFKTGQMKHHIHAMGQVGTLAKGDKGHSTQQQKPSCIPCKDIFTTYNMQVTYACLVLACSFAMACKARYTVYPHKHRNAHNMHPA